MFREKTGNGGQANWMFTAWRNARLLPYCSNAEEHGWLIDELLYIN
jgi:hypothetical protein